MMSNKRQVFVSLDHRDSLCRQEQTAILNLLESTTLADVCDLRKCLRSLGFDTVTQGPESDALSPLPENLWIILRLLYIYNTISI